jgi:hypothetical protein
MTTLSITRDGLRADRTVEIEDGDTLTLERADRGYSISIGVKGELHVRASNPQCSALAIIPQALAFVEIVATTQRVRRLTRRSLALDERAARSQARAAPGQPSCRDTAQCGSASARPARARPRRSWTPCWLSCRSPRPCAPVRRAGRPSGRTPRAGARARGLTRRSAGSGHPHTQAPAPAAHRLA